MRKLNLEAGFPQILQDYPIIAEDNCKRALEAFLSPFDNVIISGLGVSIAGDNWTIAAGYVIFEGEVMRVEEHTINSVGSSILIAESYEVTISNNPKPYLNGETKPLIVEKLCRIIKRTTEPTYVRFLTDLKPLEVKLAEVNLPFNNEWLAPASGKYTLATGVSRDLDNPFFISKTKDGQLRMKGSLSWDMLSANITGGFRDILTITDVAFRPAYEVVFSIPKGTDGPKNGNEYGYYFSLMPNGKLRLRHDSETFGIGPINFSPVNLNIY